jgi:hypothetical protein
MLPSLQLLEKVNQEIKNIPNRRGEHLRKVHYGCYLLCHKSGLRVSETVSFDLENKTEKGLYRISKPKGKKERFVYVSKEVIRELKANNWQPNQTNRWNFYFFLKKIKRELNISGSVELSPHTLRRSFATYHAEAGLSLPILAKILGHSSIRTTALYWKNTYQDPNNEVGPILAGKNWLESREPPERPLSTENFPEKKGIYSELSQIPKNPKPIFIDQKPLIPNKNPTHANNSLSVSKTTAKTPAKLVNEISPNSQGIFLLNASQKKDQLKTTQQLIFSPNEGEKSSKQELILLQKIKKLEEQLKQTTTERDNLKQLLHQEKQRADNYQQQLKIIVRTLKQWQKNNYCQQLEQEQKAQIEQSPPWKPPNK